MTTTEDTAGQVFDPRLLPIVREQPYPLIFASISGAHLYGFPSPDSDYDLRGVHVLPLRQVVGLETGPETIEVEEVRDGLELDLVTHDAKKFFHLLLKPNGYVWSKSSLRSSCTHRRSMPSYAPLPASASLVAM